jgi:hypothetical protein
MVDQFKIYLIRPLIAMMKTLFKKRNNHLRILVLLQLFTYGLYWLRLDDNLLYLYLLQAFEGFNETKYVQFQIYQRGICTAGLFIIVPFLSNYLKFHDSMVQMTICFTESLSLLLIPFVTTLWQFYLIQGNIFYCLGTSRGPQPGNKAGDHSRGPQPGTTAGDHSRGPHPGNNSLGPQTGATAGDHSRGPQPGTTSRGPQPGTTAGDHSRGPQPGTTAGDHSRGPQSGTTAGDQPGSTAGD